VFLKEKKVFTVAALISMALFLSGCAGLSQGRRRVSAEEGSLIPEGGVSLEVAAAFRFDDIPVPIGFKIDQFGSFAFQTEYTRVGLLKYKGRANPDKVVAFYKDQMPLYGWALVNIIEYGKRIINFEKEGQSCIITIEPTGSKTILTIAISPKSEIK